MAPLLLANEPHYEDYKTGDYINPKYIDDDWAERKRPPEFNFRNNLPPPPPPPLRGRRHRHHRIHRGFYDSDDSEASFSRQRRRRFYTTGRGRRDIVFYLNLVAKLPESPELTKKKATTWPNLHPEAGIRKTEKLNILASMNYSDESDKSTIELTCNESPSVSTEAQESFINWRHVQRENMSLEELELIALQAPSITDDMRLLVRRLMTKVNEDLLKSFRHGYYTTSASYRYDGQPSGDMDVVDIYATWMSFPYLTLIDMPPSAPTSASAKLHPSRPLFQTLYDNESTEERDREQEFLKYTQIKDGKMLHVAHAWFLILGEDTVISSARESLDNLFQPSITRNVGKGDASELLKVIDPYKRRFFFPLATCRNFFTFRQIVAAECLDDIAFQVDNCTFVYNDGKSILSSSTWHEFIQSSKSPILQIEIRQGMFLTAADLAAGQDDESSETSDSDEDEIGRRTAAQLHNPETQLITLDMERERQRSRDRQKNQKKIQNLRREGLIINDTSSMNKPTVKLYQAEKQETSDAKRSSQAVPTKTGKPDQTQQKAEVRQDPQNTTGNSSNSQSAKGIVDPFLTWPLDTGADPSKDETTGKSTEGFGLRQILDRLNEKIKDPAYDTTSGTFPTETNHLFNGKYYSAVEESALDGLRALIEAVKQVEKDDEVLQRKTETSASQKLPDSSRPSREALYTWRQEEQRLEMVRYVNQSVQLIRELVSFFSPSSFPHALLNKIWGVLAILLKIPSSMIHGHSSNQKVAPQNDQGTSSKDQKTRSISWSVRRSGDVSEESCARYRITPPQVQFSECESCTASKTYSSAEAAVKHIMVEHYPHSRLFTAQDEERLHFWIQDSNQESQEQWNKQRLITLNHCLDDLKDTHKIAQEIHDGLAVSREGDHDMPTKLVLPTALVKAFEMAAVFLICVGHTMLLLDKNLKDSARKEPKIGDVEEQLRQFLGYQGLRASISMTKAQEDITLMIRTDTQASTVNYAAVGPRYIIMSICKGLCMRKLYSGQRYIEIYQDIVSRMRYEVYHSHPTRRLLTDIQTLQEELSAIDSIQDDQYWALSELRAVCDTRSFRITTQFRNQQWRLEEDLYDQYWRLQNKNEELLRGLSHRLTQLEDKARHRIEILDEDHGKAIFVFTVVTVVFLPLSFVTSYMGMNTSDIRDTNSTQAIYWAIALPITGVVIVLGTLVAYRGDALREWFLHGRKRRREQESVSRAEMKGRKTLAERRKWLMRRQDKEWKAEV